jgi:parallel beta-helix repeat protein
MKKMWFVFVLVSALLGFTPLAWPAVFYVTPTSDNDCSDFNCDFQNALNAASGNDEGDTINLGAGAYNASALPFAWNTTKNYPLTIIGMEGVVIEGGNGGCFLIDTSNQATDSSSHIVIDTVVFQNCSGPLRQGGALFARTTDANLTILRSTFLGNTAGDGAGAFLFSSAGTVRFSNNTLRNNVATNFAGGGIYIATSSGPVTIEKSFFARNDSNIHGGGIYVVTDSGNIDLVNNTVYTNTAQVLGGGALIVTTSGTMTVASNTLTSNAADGGGGMYGGLNSDTATLQIYNNIAWNNTAIQSGDDINVCDNCTGATVGSVVNIYYNDFTDFYGMCENTVGCTPRINQGNNKNVNPQFVNVSDPDPANWDLRLASGSEAIDTGDNTMCALTDILGIPRPQDGDKNGTNICDMGAYEVMPVELSTFEGTIGTELTISGSGFGDKKGKVLIENAATKIASWTDNEIACTVKKVPLPADSNNVIIRPSSKTAPSLTLTSSFTVMNPVIDAVILGHGLPGEKITIFGRYFSTKKGKVYLEYIDKNGKTKKKNCRINSWDMNAQTGASTITFEVPKGLESSTTPYPLFVTNKVGQASSTFTIGP